MRFSAVFEPSLTMQAAQADDCAVPLFSVVPDTAPQPQVEEVPDDLAQRVREIGEWQLEDW